MSLITPDFGLLFWMTVVFLVVLLILTKFGFPVIVRMINNRKAYIDESLRKAHEANEKLANIKAESDALLQDGLGRGVEVESQPWETDQAEGIIPFDKIEIVPLIQYRKNTGALHCLRHLLQAG